MTSTTQISDVTVQLSTLYDAYDQILNQAKEQLNSLDFNPEHIKGITETIGTNKDFQQEISSQVLSAVRTDISKLGDPASENSNSLNALVDMLYMKLLEQVEKDVTKIVEQAAATALQSASLQKMIDEAVLRNTNIAVASQAQQTLHSILDYACKAMESSVPPSETTDTPALKNELTDEIRQTLYGTTPVVPDTDDIPF